MTINAGSSSLKAAVFRFEPPDTLECTLSVDRIGHAEEALRVTGPDGALVRQVAQCSADYAAALRAVLAWVRRERPETRIGAVGHRVVHGGVAYRDPQSRRRSCSMASAPWCRCRFHSEAS